MGREERLSVVALYARRRARVGVFKGIVNVLAAPVFLPIAIVIALWRYGRQDNKWIVEAFKDI